MFDNQGKLQFVSPGTKAAAHFAEIFLHLVSKVCPGLLPYSVFPTLHVGLPPFDPAIEITAPAAANDIIRQDGLAKSRRSGGNRSPGCL
jgi:hypothetical protein